MKEAFAQVRRAVAPFVKRLSSMAGRGPSGVCSSSGSRSCRNSSEPCLGLYGFILKMENPIVRRALTRTSIDASQTHALVQLHSHIESYDQVLSQMSGMLTGYQDTLGKISREIQLLQDQSQSQSLKLKNRQVRMDSSVCQI